MQWLEIIRLLASRGKIEVVLSDLSTRLDNFIGAEGQEMLTVHSSPTLGSDLLICIRWNNATSPQKSREGLLLADYLTDFGLVDHAVWKQELSARRATQSPPPG
jgi:hypothetical protein